ncbi:PadR family transcriptional regulator [Olivibacter sitiensis]|uniref:PadR family transcriptional regulator n=1 Tax=Olivibacter sitiensis TaxID=376470 RepID=UPI0004830467|nr:PadR family transcriptional regulator [Olivibacter sitiensis]
MSSAKLLKGTLQTIILKLLEDKDRMYGYEITQKVKELSDGEFKLTEGALYPTLHKLEADGLLETSTEMVDGRVRKYYSLSTDGKAEVQHKMSDAALFIEKLQQVLNLKPSIG